MRLSPHATPTVLIAGADADLRLYLRVCLGRMGFPRVVEAPDGADALHRARTEVPLLVIAARVMPGLDGPALCRALKADARTRGVPFLLVSGVRERLPPCADACLATPFNADDLEAQIGRLLP